MLADSGPAQPPIKYNCPRCKAPLESPASEALMKKPCPKCGQRLQVPAAPPPPAPVAAGGPNLNKTMLAGDESKPPIKYNCPNCKKPLEAPAIEALTKKNCQYCGQRHQVPGESIKSGIAKTMLVSDGGSAAPAPVGAGYQVGGPPPVPAAGAAAPAGFTFSARTLALAAGGVLFLLLLACVIPPLLFGGKGGPSKEQADYELRKKQLEDQMAATLADLKEQTKAAKELQKRQEEELLAVRQKEERYKFERDLATRTQAYLNDKAAKAQIDGELEQKKIRLDQERQEWEEKKRRDQSETDRKIADLQKQVQDSQKQQTIIQQVPAPAPYYPPYHPGYYWRYWW
jgi:DNA-directed RNA polymerase subunit RPC12/RpoP